MTHSVPHGFATAFHTPQGTILHSGDFKLDLTPVDGRLTDLARIGAIAKDPGIRLLLSDSTNADETGHAPQREVGRQRAVRPVPRQRRASDRNRLLRQPHPSRAADRRRGDRVRPHHRDARHVDEEERPAGARDGSPADPGQPTRRHRGHRRHRSRQGVRDLDRVAGRADVGARVDGIERQPVDQGRSRGHRHPELAPDPGERSERARRSSTA